MTAVISLNETYNEIEFNATHWWIQNSPQNIMEGPVPVFSDHLDKFGIKISTDGNFILNENNLTTMCIFTVTHNRVMCYENIFNSHLNKVRIL